MKPNLLTFLATSAASWWLFLVPLGCGDLGSTTSDEDARPSIVTTTGMIADLAKTIVGDAATVHSLMGPGVDPHLYKPTEGDVRRLSEADLVLYNGLHLEGKMADILGKMGREKSVVPVAEVLRPDQLLSPPGFSGQPDPHVWFDVGLWAQTIDAILPAVEKLVPEKKGLFADTASALRAELLELDEWVLSRIRSLPEERRILVTAHDAFGYFGRRYGMEVVGLQGISTATEAGVRDVTRLVDLIVARSIPAIFVESSVSSRSIESVQAACRERGHSVEIGGSLFSDAMGADGTEGGTYPGMVRQNVETIVGALSPAKVHPPEGTR